MTEGEYERAMRRINEIFLAEPNTPVGEELDALVTAVAAYEAEHYPIPEPTPEEAAQFRREQEETGDVKEPMDNNL